MLSSIMLICGVAASLAIGILVAYGLCVAMFSLFRIHARQVAARRSTPAAQPLPLRVLGS